MTPNQPPTGRALEHQFHIKAQGQMTMVLVSTILAVSVREYNNVPQTVLGKSLNTCTLFRIVMNLDNFWCVTMRKLSGIFEFLDV